MTEFNLYTSAFDVHSLW